MENLSLDIETYSSEDLAKAGVYRYAESPDFTVLLIGYIWGVGKVPDMRRTFQYHGSEHKTVYCHEAGHEGNIRLHVLCLTLAYLGVSHLVHHFCYSCVHGAKV